MSPTPPVLRSFALVMATPKVLGYTEYSNLAGRAQVELNNPRGPTRSSWTESDLYSPAKGDLNSATTSAVPLRWSTGLLDKVKNARAGLRKAFPPTCLVKKKESRAESPGLS